MKNKLILFDWGNIVESHTTGYTCYDAFIDLFSECGYKGKDEIFSLIRKYNFCTLKSVDEFKYAYKLMAEEFNFDKTFEEFVEIYIKTFNKIDYYKDVANYEVSLKDRCYIGILSNLTVFDKGRLDKQVNLSLYDYVFLSFEMGLKKPDIEIYDIVQSNVPFAPDDILFIDDKKDNVEMASKLGWNVLQATGLELVKIQEKCEEFLN